MGAPRRKQEPIADQLAELEQLRAQWRTGGLTREQHARLELLDKREEQRLRRLPGRLDRARRKLAQLEALA